MTHVFLFGDSIAYGAWDPKGGWFKSLREFYDKNGFESDDYNILFYNMGVSGDTSEGLLKRFDSEISIRIEPEKDNIVIFEIGKNDSALLLEKGGKNWIDKEQFRANLMELRALAGKYSDTVIFIGLGTCEDNGIYRKYIPEIQYTSTAFRDYDSIIKSIATKTGAGYIDMFKTFSKADTKEVFDDGVHPNSNGHALIFRAVRSYLTKKNILPKKALGKLHDYGKV